VFVYLDAVSFNKLLTSIKSGKGIEDGETSQFDERTEESSALQYFQVYISSLIFHKNNICRYLVL
jgi:hypothetical protein